MSILLKAVLLIAVLIIAGNIFLALRSQKGSERGLVDGRLAPCPSKPNCVCSEGGTDPDKSVAPLNSDMRTIKQAIIDTGGTVTSESGSYLSATYMSRLFKFVDDVEVRCEADGPCHIRSASRVGHSDMGANKKRVEKLRAVIKERQT